MRDLFERRPLSQMGSVTCSFGNLDALKKFYAGQNPEVLRQSATASRLLLLRARIQERLGGASNEEFEALCIEHDNAQPSSNFSDLRLRFQNLLNSLMSESCSSV